MNIPLHPFVPENFVSGVARRVQPSRPASACSFSILRLNMVYGTGIFYGTLTQHFMSVKGIDQHVYIEYSIFCKASCTVSCTQEREEWRREEREWRSSRRGGSSSRSYSDWRSRSRPRTTSPLAWKNAFLPPLFSILRTPGRMKRYTKRYKKSIIFNIYMLINAFHGHKMLRECTVKYTVYHIQPEYGE